MFVNWNSPAAYVQWGRQPRFFFTLLFRRDVSRPGYVCFLCAQHPVSRNERSWARCAAPTPWFPLACLPRVSVAAQRTNRPDKPTLTIHAKPINAAHSQTLSREFIFYWYTRHVWESTCFVLLQPSAWCIVYASCEIASRDIAARAVPVLTGSSADAAILASADVRLSGKHCAAAGGVLGDAARDGRPASCSAMSCRIRTLRE